MPWIILVSMGISTVISILIYFLSKSKNRIYKYIPTMIFFILFIYFFIMSKVTTDFVELGNIIYFLVALFTSVLTLIISILFDLTRRKK